MRSFKLVPADEVHPWLASALPTALNRSTFLPQPVGAPRCARWKKSGQQQLALRETPELAALTFSIDAAQERIEQARAGHLPSVSLYASAGRQKSSSESSYDQRYATNSIGVQINVPIFAGGGVSASVRQATDNREKLRYERDARRDEILNGLRQQFNLHHSSVAKMRALEFS